MVSKHEISQSMEIKYCRTRREDDLHTILGDKRQSSNDGSELDPEEMELVYARGHIQES